MKRPIGLAATLLLHLGCMSSAQKPPNEAANGAEYELTFTGMWNAGTHPLEVPEAGPFSSAFPRARR